MSDARADCRSEDDLIEKPPPEWAMIAAEPFYNCDDQESVQIRVARLVAKTRADALREVARWLGEKHGCDCEYDVLAMIDKEPS